jgi:hypothetical protein
MYIYHLFYLLVTIDFIKTLKHNVNFIYLFKLLRLLHKRIDPTVDLLRSKQPKQPEASQKRVLSDKNPNGAPPIGAPSWCLSDEALEKFGRQTENIPVYDYDTGDAGDDDHVSIDSDNEGNDDERREGKKRKKKKKSSKKKRKKSKSK